MPPVSPLGPVRALVLATTLALLAPAAAAAQPYSITGVFTFNAHNVASAINPAGVVTGTKYPCCVDIPSAGYRWNGAEQAFQSGPADLVEYSFEAINGSGVVAGRAGFGPQYVVETRAVVGVGTEVLDLGIPDSWAHDINDAGLVAGEHVVAGQSRGFVADLAGAVIPLGTLGGTTSVVHGINQAGVVVGESRRADGTSHAFMADGDYSSLADLGTLGGAGSVAYDINEAGVAVGSAQAADGLWYPVVFRNGTVEQLGTAPGRAAAINDAGIVVGTLNATGAFRAIGGVVRDLNTMVPSGTGWYLWEALDVNDARQIVGRGVYIANGLEYHRGFVLNEGTVGIPAPPAGRALALRALPSVTSAGARLAFGAPLAGAARIELFDGSGRMLRRLEAPAGASTVEWDGRDARGRLMPPGIVLVRASGAGWDARTRLFVVR